MSFARLESYLAGRGAEPAAGAERVGPDDFPLEPGSPCAAEHRLLSAALERALGRSGEAVRGLAGPLGGASPEERHRHLLALVERRVAIELAGSLAAGPLAHDDPLRRAAGHLRDLLAAAMKACPRLERADVERLVTWLGSYRQIAGDVSGVLRRAREALDEDPSAAPLRAALERLGRTLLNGRNDGGLSLLAEVLGRDPRGRDAPWFRLAPGEVWSDAALASIERRKEPERGAWLDLIEHALTARGARPSARWSERAGALIERVGRGAFSEAASGWFALVGRGRSAPFLRRVGDRADPNLLIVEPNATCLKGLVWCAARLEDPVLARALGVLAVTAYAKVPGVGPRLAALGNACVHALGVAPGGEGVGQLAVLKARVKVASAQRWIEKALAATAERVGLSRDELEEIAVPAYGLTASGTRREELGSHACEVAVVGSGVELRWLRPDGSPQRSVPRAVRERHGEELRELRQAARDIERMLPAQAERIERAYLAEKEWELPVWRRRYLEHPLVGTIARRLIWTFTRGGREAAGIWHEGRLVDPRGEEVDGIGDAVRVRLWHPFAAGAGEVASWRAWLIEHEVKQPFKQAHREVYRLTDAERRTRTYSNRFAAHIVRQHQFNALCAARGWRNRLRLLVDDLYPPASIEIPRRGLRAELWVEGAGDAYGVDTTEAGVYLHLSTDQVRFYRAGAASNLAHAAGGGYTAEGPESDENEPLPLDAVPALVFSEVMRDVDLFVGVSSVGNDPTWADGGPGGRYREYWDSYSFGELGASAHTRRSVLEGLVPRLAIAERLTLAGRFLRVRGDLRTYKIHLGSGNVLMEPNDEYLCIVPGERWARSGDRVFLPFEGDARLGVILSKAFLLAGDARITDPSIARQIRG